MEDEEEEMLLKKQRTALLLEGFPPTRESDDFDDETEARKEEEEIEHEGEKDANRVKVQELVDQYQKSEEKAELMDEIEAGKNAPPSKRDTTWKPLPFHSQTIILTCRSFACLFNDTQRVIGEVVVLTFLGVILASGFWDLGYSAEDVQNRVSLLFFVLMMCYITAEPFFGLCLFSPSFLFDLQKE